MKSILNVINQETKAILAAPGKPRSASHDSVSFQLSVGIPDYGWKIANHYADQVDGNLGAICSKASLAFDLSSFGLIVTFDKPLELELYDGDSLLDENVKKIINHFGPLIFRNAYLATKFRNQGQRNIFPDLNFHVDRGSNQDNQYSLFCRDPFDDVQKAPRESSTLFIANIVAYLQSVKEGHPPKTGPQTLYSIFKDEDIKPLIGDIVLEQPWTEPEGTGEICVLDNRTIQHASYYRGGRGYPIGVRYLF